MLYHLALFAFLPASGSLSSPAAEDAVPTVAPAPSNALKEQLELAPATDNAASWLNDVKVDFYGYIKADAQYQASQLDSSNAPSRAVQGGDDDGQFAMTARQTRVGVNIAGPQGEGYKTTGRIELDFYGGGGENSAMLRTRHAYLNMDCKDADLSVLFGQTSDVVSPLVAPTVNYFVLWRQGDIGFRRNQLRVTKGFEIGEDTRLLVKAAATRSTGGESAGHPGYQAYVGTSFPGIGGRKTTIGVSTHQAREGGGAESDSTALSVEVPVCGSTSIKGEYWTGENVDAYVGNAGTGVESDGMWLAVTHKASDKVKFNVGYGMEDPDDVFLAANDLSENSTIYGNVFYAVDSATTIAFELAQHDSSYLGAQDEDGLRVQLAAIFKF